MMGEIRELCMYYIAQKQHNVFIFVELNCRLFAITECLSNHYTSVYDRSLIGRRWIRGEAINIYIGQCLQEYFSLQRCLHLIYFAIYSVEELANRPPQSVRRLSFSWIQKSPHGIPFSLKFTSVYHISSVYEDKHPHLIIIKEFEWDTDCDGLVFP